MALLYGLFRVIAFALLSMAIWRHRRVKSRLEKADSAFREIENSCKADEVASGKPADFASQFKLMKRFEIRDNANERWKHAANRLQKRQLVSTRLKSWTGKKIPYAFGAADMALVLAGQQWFAAEPERMELISQLLSKVL